MKSPALIKLKQERRKIILDLLVGGWIYALALWVAALHWGAASLVILAEGATVYILLLVRVKQLAGINSQIEAERVALNWEQENRAVRP